MNNFLKAYTIIETLTSIIIMGIVITMTYAVINMMNKQMVNYSSESFEIWQYNLFNSTFKYDLKSASEFTWQNKILSLNYYDNQKITYKFLNKKIIRITKKQIDSFMVETREITAETIPDSDRVELSINLKVLNESVTGFYFINQNTVNAINTFYK